MKYELKRKSGKNMKGWGIFIFLGYIYLALRIDYEEGIFYGVLIMLVGAGLLIYEFIRSKGPVLTFDKNEFYIGETRYSYKDITRVDSWYSRRIIYYKRRMYVKIIVDDKVVYKFDSDYENSNEFVKQLTLHGVEHNIFGR